MKHTKDIVTEIIASTLGVSTDSILPHATLVEELGVDSFDMVQIYSYIEDELNVEVADEDVEIATTVQELIDFITTKVG